MLYYSLINGCDLYNKFTVNNKISPQYNIHYTIYHIPILLFPFVLCEKRVGKKFFFTRYIILYDIHYCIKYFTAGVLNLVSWTISTCTHMYVETPQELCGTDHNHCGGISFWANRGAKKYTSKIHIYGVVQWFQSPGESEKAHVVLSCRVSSFFFRDCTCKLMK